ncbi:hypothetical protein CWI38_0671p0010 [Hamiltosporidium tvaerminnensis]|uniref:Uncharacterized protein n=1 Tax=Hamiltosporidium tvaerminnensis TaxID=1176355 RepID=A0A4Q9LVF9_9MICR|nr:hypothetical protein CWI38_0671p0010 [Hamiltosporidium tvaerminnensis]
MSYLKEIELHYYDDLICFGLGNPKYDFKELQISNLYVPWYFLDIFKNNLYFDFIPVENHVLNYICLSSLQILFKKYKFSRLKKLSLYKLPVFQEDSESLSNLSYIEELKIYKIYSKNITFLNYFVSQKNTI